MSADILDYSALTADYDEKRYIGAWNELKEEYSRRVFQSLLPLRVDRSLDVACGTGRGVLTLAERSRLVVGADATFEMLARARKKTVNTPACYCSANGAQLPFRGGTFDLVACLNFLHLFPDRASKLEFVLEAARVLRPGGTAVFDFENALQGLFLGPFRKYFVKDIGYDWPWLMRSCFPRSVFRTVTCRGSNIPFVWRVRRLRRLESTACVFPFKYLANRILVSAVRR